MDLNSLSDLSIVVPAFNEELNIEACLKKLIEGAAEAEIIVIDDGSTDATAAIIRRHPRIKLISHERNRGYGAALKTGMRRSRGKIIAWYDSDGQHQIEDLKKVYATIKNHGFDAAFGQRSQGSAFTMSRVPGKWILRMVSQAIARRKIPDLNCGLRAFKRDIITRYLHLLPDGFSASATTTLLMIKRGYHLRFIPIITVERQGTSTVKMIRDGRRTLAILLRIMLLFDSFLFFLVLSSLQLACGLIYSVYLAVHLGRGVPVLGALMILSGVLTFFFGIIASQISELRQERFENNLDVPYL